MSFFSKIFNIKNYDTPADKMYFNTFGSQNGEYIEINTAQDVKMAYMTNPVINAIANKMAGIFSKIEIKEFGAKENELQNTPFLNAIHNPSVFYGENEFLTQIGLQLALYHTCIILINRTIGMTLRNGDGFIVLDFANCDVKYKKNINIREVRKIADIIDNVKYIDDNNNVAIFYPAELIFISTNSKQDLNATPYLKACEGAINVINFKYSLLNSLYSRNGGFGIFSNTSAGIDKDFNSGNLEETEKKQLQSELKQYSFKRGGQNFIITNRNLQYQNITFPIADMNLDESSKAAITDIANCMNFEILSLNSLDGSTYSNKENSDKNLIQNSIIPFWDLVETSFQKENLTQNLILFDYSQMPELQTDKQTEYNNTKINDEIQITRYNNGLITFNELRIALGLEAVQNGAYYNQITVTNGIQ